MAIKSSLVNFKLATNAKVVVNPKESTELWIRGLQGMGLAIGFTMQTTTVAEMGRRIALVVPTGGTYEETQVNYNFIPGDASLDTFRNAALNATNLQAIRLYVEDDADFSAPDKISDSAAGLYVGSMSDPKTDSPNGLFTGSLSYMPSGPFALFVAHAAGGTSLSYTTATRTLTYSGGDFTALGFEVGDTIIIDYDDDTNAPMYAKAETVGTTTMVLTAATGDIASIPTDHTFGANGAIHGATPQPVS